MPTDYGDSWDQGQRCYFSFGYLVQSDTLVSGIEGDGVLGIQTQPFFQYDEPIKRGRGTSVTKVSTKIELYKNLSLICEWNVHNEGTESKPDIKANKIEVNQVIKIKGFNNKSNCEFIGLVKSINQPDQLPSKGRLSVSPIFIIHNIFNNTDPIVSWTVIVNEDKTSNYEINKDYAAVEAFGLTGNNVGKAGFLTIIDEERNEEINDTFEKGSYIAYTSDDGSGSESYGQLAGTDFTRIVTYLEIHYFINYFGDINYYPFDQIYLNTSLKTFEYGWTMTVDKLSFSGPVLEYGSYNNSEYTSNKVFQPEDNLETLENEQIVEQSSFEISYTFTKESLENQKLFDEDPVENKDIRKITEYEQIYQDTSDYDTIHSSSYNPNYGNLYEENAYPTLIKQIRSDIYVGLDIPGIKSIKITPSNFTK